MQLLRWLSNQLGNQLTAKMALSYLIN